MEAPDGCCALDRTGDRRVITDLRRRIGSCWQLIDRTDALPMTYAHGDASPQNMLVPAARPETFVVIDPGFHSQLPVGHDLGQLLVGLCHAGAMDPDELPAVHDVLTPAYAAGLAAENKDVEVGEVADGYLSGLLLRSAFTAIPLEQIGAPTTQDAVDLWTTGCS